MFETRFSTVIVYDLQLLLRWFWSQMFERLNLKQLHERNLWLVVHWDSDPDGVL